MDRPSLERYVPKNKLEYRSDGSVSCLYDKSAVGEWEKVFALSQSIWFDCEDLDGHLTSEYNIYIAYRAICG